MAKGSSSSNKSVTFSEPASSNAPEILEDPSRLQRLFRKAFNDRTSMLSCTVAEVTLSIPFSFAEIRDDGQGMEIELRIADEASAVAAEQAKSIEKDAEFMFVLYAGNQGIFGFRTQVISYDQASLVLRFPAKVLRTQKRKEPRFTIPGGYEIYVKMRNPNAEGQYVNRRLFDVSSQGLSFVVSGNEAARYAKGTLIRRLLFTIRGKSFIVDAQVCVTAELPVKTRTPGVKIGIKFLRILDSDRQFLAAYVMENLIQYETSVDV